MTRLTEAEALAYLGGIARSTLWPTPQDVPEGRGWVVYTLVDPREPDVPRYIGSTGNARARLSRHHAKRKQAEIHARIWFYSLRRARMKPAMRLVATCASEPAARILEAHLAWALKEIGCAIVGEHSVRRSEECAA